MQKAGTGGVADRVLGGARRIRADGEIGELLFHGGSFRVAVSCANKMAQNGCATTTRCAPSCQVERRWFAYSRRRFHVGGWRTMAQDGALKYFAPLNPSYALFDINETAAPDAAKEVVAADLS